MNTSKQPFGGCITSSVPILLTCERDNDDYFALFMYAASENVAVFVEILGFGQITQWTFRKKRTLSQKWFKLIAHEKRNEINREHFEAVWLEDVVQGKWTRVFWSTCKCLSASQHVNATPVNWSCNILWHTYVLNLFRNAHMDCVRVSHTQIPFHTVVLWNAIAKK